jgi:hypothetical protein
MFDQRCDSIASTQLSSAASVNMQHVPGYFRFLTQDQALDQSRNPCASTSRVIALVHLSCDVPSLDVRCNRRCRQCRLRVQQPFQQ